MVTFGEPRPIPDSRRWGYAVKWPKLLIMNVIHSIRREKLSHVKEILLCTSSRYQTPSLQRNGTEPLRDPAGDQPQRGKQESKTQGRSALIMSVNLI
jgi:hypothetical protein